MKQYLLTEPIFKRLSKRYGLLKCHYCGELLKPKETISKIESNNSNISITTRIMKNQEVVSVSHGKGKKYYHKECYEKLFID
jgi:hypothetical protein